MFEKTPVERESLSVQGHGQKLLMLKRGRKKYSVYFFPLPMPLMTTRKVYIFIRLLKQAESHENF
jgi:hypothetical protein